MAGVYNRYQQTTFAEHDFQQEPAAQEGKEYIRERLREFRENPAMARDFFKRKLEDQWIEPLFSSLKATESFDTDGEPLSSGITSLYYGNIHETVWKRPIITRVSYTWQDLYLELLCAEDGGKKKKFRQHCGCR